MGLLKPTSGSLVVGGHDILDHDFPNRLLSWRKAIAHVLKSIFLADSAIAQNIAFGMPESLIDLERVKIAAERAQIAGFIESMEEKYDTHVGEQGARLSGG